VRLFCFVLSCWGFIGDTIISIIPLLETEREGFIISYRKRKEELFFGKQNRSHKNQNLTINLHFFIFFPVVFKDLLCFVVVLEISLQLQTPKP
jgi:hypothetical protein